MGMLSLVLASGPVKMMQLVLDEEASDQLYKLRDNNPVVIIVINKKTN